MSVNSVNVYRAVYECLNRHSAVAAIGWRSKFPLESAVVSVAEQQRNVNTFWRLQLGLLTVNTIKERECLVDEMSFTTWIKDFEKYVVPTIIKHQLPSN